MEEDKIDKTKLEIIEKEFKKQTTISEERKNKINKRVFQNVGIAIFIVLYFVFINLGYYNLEPLVYLKDLQVFSMLSIIFTIVLFEKAYKKDELDLTLYSIEALAVSIATLCTIYIGMKFGDQKYPYIINLITIAFALYYVIKAGVIYIKMKKKALKRTSDIHKIIKSKNK